MTDRLHEGGAGASRPPRRRIDLRQHLVHIASAHLMLDLLGGRMGKTEYQELGECYAMAVVATGADARVLAAKVGRRAFEEVAVAALDKAVAVVARDRRGEAGAYWQLTGGCIDVVTDGQTPFSSKRFREAVADLGCRHEVVASGG